MICQIAQGMINEMQAYGGLYLSILVFGALGIVGMYSLLTWLDRRN